MRFSLFLLLLMLHMGGSFGQNDKKASHRLASPYETLETFFYALERQHNDTAAAIIFNDPHLSTSQRIKYVHTLNEILEGRGILIEVDELPKNPDYLDSLTQAHQYVLTPSFPALYLQKRQGRWQFQPHVMQQMDSIHQEMYAFGNRFMVSEELKSHELSAMFLGLKLWQWLGILTVLSVSFLIRYILALLFGRLLTRFFHKIGYKKMAEQYVMPVVRPVSMMVVYFFIAALFPSLQLPKLVGHYIALALKVLIPLYGLITAYRLVDVLEVYFIKIAQKTRTTLDDQLVPLLKKILKISVVVIGSLVILDSLNVPIVTLLTGLSIGGLAFALAAQDTIKNFFGSLMIFIDKPFQVGDWITADAIDGTVEEVGFRSTRIRTFRNSVIYVPNGKLADATIDNNGLRRFRRFKTTVQITYDTPPDLVDTFVKGLERLVHKHPKTNNKNYEIHFHNLGIASLDILFYIFFESPTWSDELKFRQEILLDIMRLAEHLGIRFAFPTQTLHLAYLSKASTDSTAPTDQAAMHHRLDEYFQHKG